MEKAKSFKEYVGGISFGWGVVFMALFVCFWPCGYRDDLGKFGDSFGVVTSFLTALALAGVAYTAFLQRQTYQLQREEWESELEKTRIAKREEQLRDIERTFHDLLNTHGRIVSEVPGKRSTDHQFTYGLPALHLILKEFRAELANSNVGNLHLDDEGKRLAILKKVCSFFEVYNPHLASADSIVRVMRSLEYIVQYLENASPEILSADKKSGMVAYLKAIVSTPELAFFFYYSACKNSERLNKALREFQMFAALDVGALADKSHKNLNIAVFSESSESNSIGT